MKSIALRGMEAQPGDWFHHNWPSEEGPFRIMRFRATFAGVGRGLGQGVPALGAEELKMLREAGIPAPERWRRDDYARVALLIRTLEFLPADGHAEFVRDVYLRGDFREQAAVLRSLILLPRPERFVDMAIAACRTDGLDVFEAIACENPYPASHFPAPNFNQLVIKALFMGVALARVVGVSERNTRELRRMARDFASERRAAGRPVPADVDLVLQ